MKTKETYLKELTEIFRQELSEPSLALNFNSSPNTVDKWDSVNNLLLITAIEDYYQINFPIDFIFEAEKVEDFCDFLMKSSKN